MILALCVDNRMGLSFQSRRLSKDVCLRSRLYDLSQGRLRMSPYSAKQFSQPVFSGEDYLTQAEPSDWCFVEREDYLPYLAQANRIVLFCWNRDYPADVFFQIPQGWHQVSREEFPGKSHDLISMEVYEP